jgi:hypothetical protein
MVGHPGQPGQPGRAKTGGRQPGTANNITQKALLELVKLGGDPPHLALLKIGRDMTHPITVRVTALGLAAPYFQPRMAAPAAKIIDPVDMGDIRDAPSAAEAAAKVFNKVNAGKLDIECGEFLLDGIERYAQLYEREQLQMRVLVLEEQMRARAQESVVDVPVLSVIEGGR